MAGIQQFDTTMQLLQKTMDLRSKNQEIIGSNIANAETPGYSAQSFTFEDQLKNALSEKNGLQPVPSQSNHIPIVPDSLEQVTGTVSSKKESVDIGDKNNVSVDQEMLKLSQNEILYETAVAMFNKKLSLLKYAANGGA